MLWSCCVCIVKMEMKRVRIRGKKKGPRTVVLVGGKERVRRASLELH